MATTEKNSNGGEIQQGPLKFRCLLVLTLKMDQFGTLELG